MRVNAGTCCLMPGTRGQHRLSVIMFNLHNDVSQPAESARQDERR